MKGVIFNVLEQVYTDRYDADAWYDLVEASNSSGIYTSLGSYPDEELVSLIETAALTAGHEFQEMLRWFGRAALPVLAKKYPHFFAPHREAESLVRSVNEIIHPEVRKLYAGAGCPHFHFGSDEGGRMLIGYNSARQMCRLVEGFVHGVSDYYLQTAEIEHLACMHEGAPRCLIAVNWS